MQILLTLDYELFLGKSTGSIEHCLIEPMKQLNRIVDKYNAKFTIFVDATYLLRLKQLKNKHNSLLNNYERICSHIISLKEKGHDIELHIHPNWMFSQYANGQWTLDNNYYRLAELPLQDAINIFCESKSLLETIIDEKVIAYRAGGYSTQPFDLLKKCFEINNILLDSSVVPGNKYESAAQYYDYSISPSSSIYRFEEDICVENVTGKFIELPLANMRISPLFYWKLVLNRILKQAIHLPWGDGKSVAISSDSIIQRLTHYTYAYATIDDYKSSYLQKALNQSYKKYGNEGYFTVIGHPKLATPYSIQKLDEFLKSNIKKHRFIKVKDLFLK